MEHAAVPEQLPPHPAKVEPALAVAVRVTVVPEAKLALQAVPQLMPVGLEITVPVPVPPMVTLRTLVLGIATNVAVTV